MSGEPQVPASPALCDMTGVQHLCLWVEYRNPLAVVNHDPQAPDTVQASGLQAGMWESHRIPKKLLCILRTLPSLRADAGKKVCA